jgi:hypothetical protein
MEDLLATLQMLDNAAKRGGFVEDTL